jgi:hypothetical protein
VAAGLMLPLWFVASSFSASNADKNATPATFIGIQCVLCQKNISHFEISTAFQL